MVWRTPPKKSLWQPRILSVHLKRPLEHPLAKSLLKLLKTQTMTPKTRNRTTILFGHLPPEQEMPPQRRTWMYSVSSWAHWASSKSWWWQIQHFQIFGQLPNWTLHLRGMTSLINMMALEMAMTIAKNWSWVCHMLHWIAIWFKRYPRTHTALYLNNPCKRVQRLINCRSLLLRIFQSMIIHFSASRLVNRSCIKPLLVQP